MQKVIMWNFITLEGFFEGPDKWQIDWFRYDNELEQYIIETQLSADTLLFGRVTYEGMAAYWPTAQGPIADFMNRVPKVVFSRTLENAGWNNTRLVKENVPEEVSQLKQRAAGEIFLFGSAQIASTLIQHGLIDEYRLGINPVIIGGGTPLFKSSPNRLNLTLLETRIFKSGLVILHYQPDQRS
jgi:dihydrofolate reductase